MATVTDTTGPAVARRGSDASRFSRRTSILLVLPLLVLLGAFFLVPVARLLLTSLGGEGRGYGELLGDDTVRRAFVRTFRISAEVTVISLVLGYFMAYTMWRSSRRVQTICLALVLFPLLTSVVVRNYAWTTIFSRNGALNQLLDWLGLGSTSLLNTETAVLIGMSQVMMPFAVLPIWTVLNRLDPALYRSSLSLGGSPAQTFRHVILPLSAPGVTVAALLVFIVSVGFYVTPAILGGPRATMVANVIDAEVNRYLDFRAGASLSFLLLTVTLALVALAYRAFDVDRVLRETS